MICKFSSERQGKMEVQVFQIYLKKSELLFFLGVQNCVKKTIVSGMAFRTAHIYFYMREDQWGNHWSLYEGSINN